MSGLFTQRDVMKIQLLQHLNVLLTYLTSHFQEV